MTREEMLLVSRHSNWSIESVKQRLASEIYSKPNDWRIFLRILLLVGGTGFMLSGIIFFFAYNWDGLHKFAKIGLVELLLLASILIVGLRTLSPLAAKLLLTSGSILTGVLFAVYGQIYQTGADAYDFFLAWTVSILLWVIISRFAFLWLIFIALLQTTIVLYFMQRVEGSAFLLLMNLLFAINAAILLIVNYSQSFHGSFQAPRWFDHLFLLAAVSIVTLGICVGMFSEFDYTFGMLIFLSALFYFWAYRRGHSFKKISYIILIPFSLMIILACLFLKISTDPFVFLLISMGVVVGLTFLIKYALETQKSWNHEN